ncbi:hypothetical protein STAFG_3502 [Streptomyces afghaniensis 772]|uniref:Uncharacterized protein n=1 Tax=Streptomyces afghaniensis 772 TaxID=1283301 RepID=S4MRU8_9ACTN|nr:hypothetical protein STAFG_3502 [Streptomyces afghaniensis 772]
MTWLTNLVWSRLAATDTAATAATAPPRHRRY